VMSLDPLHGLFEVAGEFCGGWGAIILFDSGVRLLQAKPPELPYWAAREQWIPWSMSNLRRAVALSEDDRRSWLVRRICAPLS
jgi:hypothetical protein